MDQAIAKMEKQQFKLPISEGGLGLSDSDIRESEKEVEKIMSDSRKKVADTPRDERPNPWDWLDKLPEEAAGSGEATTQKLTLNLGGKSTGKPSASEQILRAAAARRSSATTPPTREGSPLTLSSQKLNAGDKIIYKDSLEGEILEVNNDSDSYTIKVGEREINTTKHKIRKIGGRRHRRRTRRRTRRRNKRKRKKTRRKIKTRRKRRKSRHKKIKTRRKK